MVQPPSVTLQPPSVSAAVSLHGCNGTVFSFFPFAVKDRAGCLPLRYQRLCWYHGDASKETHICPSAQQRVVAPCPPRSPPPPPLQSVTSTFLLMTRGHVALSCSFSASAPLFAFDCRRALPAVPPHPHPLALLPHCRCIGAPRCACLPPSAAPVAVHSWPSCPFGRVQDTRRACTSSRILLRDVVA